ncbi:hypothetical protein M406DRAFT_332309 [Cryphonectria parasitica EP155]|uniref:Uncharacterized protein n=1 Tax=Cryphonectria parasitica (strain ATCC 38755 / EP155) TaxID=660469 RepID=A0A9P5CN23_CRYP1|nr:uncharacterized protein M406DRAFT_332309 [Cryphonectria parasitica EP155]KAF3763862.1 hypothetical protein M406DRAFT_332309 [Cryphonectria parasitica EP155]
MASIIHKERTGKGLKISEDVVLKEEMYEEEDDPPRPNIWRDLPSKFQDFATIQAAMHQSVANPSFLARGASVAQVERDFERIFGAMTRPPVHSQLDMAYAAAPPRPPHQATDSPAQALHIDTSLPSRPVPASAHPAAVPSPLTGQTASTPGSMLSPGMSPAALGSPTFTFGLHPHSVASPMTTPNTNFPQMSPPLNSDHMTSRSQSVAASEAGSGSSHVNTALHNHAASQGLRRARQASSGLRSALHTPGHSTATTPSGEPLSKRRRSEYDAPLTTTPGPPTAHFTSQLPQNLHDIFAGAWMDNMQGGWQLDNPGLFGPQQTPMVLQDPPPPRNQHRHSVPFPNQPMSRISSQLSASATGQPASAATDCHATRDSSSISPTLVHDSASPRASAETTPAATFDNDLALYEMAKSNPSFDWCASNMVADLPTTGDFNIDDFLNMPSSQEAADNINNNGLPWY